MKDEVFISLQTFSERIDVSVEKAREISRRRDLCEKGISVNINGSKRGGTRIHWQKYLAHVEVCPVVPPSKYARDKSTEWCAGTMR